MPYRHTIKPSFVPDDIIYQDSGWIDPYKMADYIHDALALSVGGVCDPSMGSLTLLCWNDRVGNRRVSG